MQSKTVTGILTIFFLLTPATSVLSASPEYDRGYEQGRQEAMRASKPFQYMFNDLQGENDRLRMEAQQRQMQADDDLYRMNHGPRPPWAESPERW